jgi:hypothetical protein
MRELRLHVTLTDEPPTEKQRTVAYLEVSVLVEDEIDVGQYGALLNARCTIEDQTANAEARYTVDLVPGPV